jgi:acyl-CoA synthetase (AMP-forming)/AMP-acid ligase II
MPLPAARDTATIPAQFERTLSEFAGKEAIFVREASLTFRQLHSEALAAAQALAELGVNAGDRVGVCMQKTLDQVVAILGVLWANAILVPIHPALRGEQIGHIVKDCDMKLLITESPRVAEFRPVAAGRILLGRGPAEEEIPSLVELRRDCDKSETFSAPTPMIRQRLFIRPARLEGPKGSSFLIETSLMAPGLWRAISGRMRAIGLRVCWR